MKRDRLLKVCALMLVLVVLSAFVGCGSREETETKETPEAANNAELVFTTPVPSVTPAPVGGESSSEPQIILTPEPSVEPITIKLQYQDQDVKTLSFPTSTVFQLVAVTSDGSSGGSWTSSDASAASVDENGFVTCWKAGSPTITYTQGGVSESCTVTITAPTVHIYFAGAEKNDISISGAYGWDVQLTAIVTPEGSKVTWSSDDAGIAAVTEDGLVTAKRMGVTTIHAKCGTADATCIVRVTGVPPAALVATPEPTDNTPRIVITWAGVPDPNFTIRVGEAWDMDYILYNIDPSAAVTWSVGDPEYATVDENGVIVALKSTWGIAPNRNYTTLTATCGEYKYESVVFIREKDA